MPQRSENLDRMFHALADPTRRAVLARLAQGPASVCDLAEPFDMALPSFVQHLKVLEASGLVRSQKAGRVRTCEFDLAALEAAEGWIAEQRALWEARLDRLEELIAELKAEERNPDPTED